MTRLVLSIFVLVFVLVPGLHVAPALAQPVERVTRLRVVDSTGVVVGPFTPTQPGEARSLRGLVPLLVKDRLLVLTFSQHYELPFFSGPETVRFVSTDCSGPAFIAWHARLAQYFAAVGRHRIYVPSRTGNPAQMITHSQLTQYNCDQYAHEGWMVPAFLLVDLREQFTPPFRVVPVP